MFCKLIFQINKTIYVCSVTRKVTSEKLHCVYRKTNIMSVISRKEIPVYNQTLLSSSISSSSSSSSVNMGEGRASLHK